MTRVWMAAAAVAALAASPATTVTPNAEWRQWGGPQRNFMVDATGIAPSWPAGGPKKLWSRALGNGHSAIAVAGGRLYTMYRPGGAPAGAGRVEERIAAFDAATGKTLWEHAYEESTQGINISEGAGPHATPLIIGEKLYTVSSRVQLFALDTGTGKVLWSHDLIKEYGAALDDRGYSASPIAYRNTVIVPAGAPGGSVLAFDQQSGALAWKGGSFPTGPGSPILITVDGQDQLVVSGANEMAGVDPSSGAVLWTHPHKTEWGLNISTPVWGADNHLLVSAAYNNGTRLLKLAQANGKTTVTERWFQSRMRVHIGTVVRLGDFAVGSSGDFGPCPMAAIDMKTGKILWQNRAFGRAMFVYADNKLIVLDEDGNLGLATVSATGLKVLAKAPLLTNRAWTAPTLVGTTLYVRDRATMAAVQLGM